jgi:DNA-binding LytR/AlgR family response regulator
MRILIIEDEEITSSQLASYIGQYNTDFEIIGILRSIKEATVWFAQHPKPDLIFSDIELLDGNVFLLYANVRVYSPIIFITAYDQFLQRAFDSNGIGYILKPYGYQKVAESLDKFLSLKNELSGSIPQVLDQTLIEQLKAALQPNIKGYKQRFTVKMRNGIHILAIEDIAYFESEDGVVFAFDKNQQKYSLNGTLNDIEEVLNPNHYFRINRAQILGIGIIDKLENYFNDRMVVKTKHTNKELIVSANRVPAFRKWLE